MGPPRANLMKCLDLRGSSSRHQRIPCVSLLFLTGAAYQEPPGPKKSSETHFRERVRLLSWDIQGCLPLVPAPLRDLYAHARPLVALPSPRPFAAVLCLLGPRLRPSPPQRTTAVRYSRSTLQYQCSLPGAARIEKSSEKHFREHVIFLF